MAVVGHEELEFVRKVIGEIIATEVHDVRAGVVYFEPVFKVVVGRVG
jgi:hypothetical protein